MHVGCRAKWWGGVGYSPTWVLPTSSSKEDRTSLQWFPGTLTHRAEGQSRQLHLGAKHKIVHCAPLRVRFFLFRFSVKVKPNRASLGTGRGCDCGPGLYGCGELTSALPCLLHLTGWSPPSPPNPVHMPISRPGGSETYTEMPAGRASQEQSGLAEGKKRRPVASKADRGRREGWPGLYREGERAPGSLGRAVLADRQTDRSGDSRSAQPPTPSQPPPRQQLCWACVCLRLCSECRQPLRKCSDVT